MKPVATGSIWLSCSVGQNKQVINEQPDYLGPHEQWNQVKPGNAITRNWLVTVNPGDLKKAVMLEVDLVSFCLQSTCIHPPVYPSGPLMEGGLWQNASSLAYFLLLRWLPAIVIIFFPLWPISILLYRRYPSPQHLTKMFPNWVDL